MEPHTAVRRAFGIFLVFIIWDIAVLMLIGFLIGIPLFAAAPVSVFLSAAYYISAYKRMDTRILKKINAQPLQEGTFPRFENLVDGVCVAYGFRKPDLFVISDAAPNMMMVGRNNHHGNLVATSGLLDRVTRVELEGLIAHELSRTRSRLTFLEGTAAILVARPMSFIPRIVGTISKRVFSPWVIAETDIRAARMTRYPTGLADALKSLNSDGREPTHNPKFCRHMWIHPPTNPLISIGFSTEDRIAALGEL
ncbi:MAG: M48 family metalloprotease [Actinomycetota bacterium]|nr:M48 family metalloprotease [Actinomycetota bacterium]